MDNAQHQLCDDVKSYQDAVWAYLLEHSDVTENGAIFVKFHTKNRRDFENHLKGRWIYGYHRVDQRTGETHDQKEARAAAVQEGFVSKKQKKREVWRASQAERRAAFDKVKRENERKRIAQQHAIEHPFVHRFLCAAACIRVLWRDNEGHQEKGRTREKAEGETLGQVS